MKKIIILLIISTITTSCNSHNKNSKIWAHRVNDTTIAQQKESKFQGFEIDLYYSEPDNQLYVCHNIEDTILHLTIDQWFSALQAPNKHKYWLDTKNLTYNNADNIASIILNAKDKYNISNNIYIESWDKHGLLRIKQYPIKTLLWVESLNWKDIDTTIWTESTRKAIDLVKPNAISCEYGMYPLLCDSFPDIDIHFWHTPADATEKNFKLTREICKKRNVKVVLVDYDEPIDY